MSLQVIELLIKESINDGKLSESERSSILKQAKDFNISDDTVNQMIDAELSKYTKKNEDRQEKARKIAESKRLEQEEAKKIAQEEVFYDNYSEWNDDRDIDEWWLLTPFVTGLLGIANSYTHDKIWYAYIFMFLLFALYGLLLRYSRDLISIAFKRGPFKDWPMAVRISYIVLIFIFILYSVIPF